jgi:hypothetical protein
MIDILEADAIIRIFHHSPEISRLIARIKRKRPGIGKLQFENTGIPGAMPRNAPDLTIRASDPDIERTRHAPQRVEEFLIPGVNQAFQGDGACQKIVRLISQQSLNIACRRQRRFCHGQAKIDICHVINSNLYNSCHQFWSGRMTPR